MNSLSWKLYAIAIILVSVCARATVANLPERKVENNVIISERDPKVRIDLPRSVQDIGADRWVLYDHLEKINEAW